MGRSALTGRTYYAHRVAFVNGGGILTAERPHVLHDCPGGDQPSCCEFAHLWSGTDQDNALDKARKGRGVRSKRGLPYGANPSGSGFAAQLKLGGRSIYLGTHPTAEQASGVAMDHKARFFRDW